MENIRKDIWDDPAFDGLPPAAKLVYIWSWTNARCGLSGIFKAATKTIAHACGLETAQAQEAVKILVAADLVAYDGQWLWCRSRVKQLVSKGPTVAKGVVRDLCHVPSDHPFVGMFLQKYGADSWLQDAFEARGIDTSSIPYPDPTDGVSNTALQSQSQDPTDTLSIGYPYPADGDGDGRSREDVRGKAGGSRARSKSRPVDSDSLPPDFPEHLHSALDDVLLTLQRLALERGGNTPTRRGVANKLARFPDRDHRAVAADLHDWATGGNGANATGVDWVARYGNFLGKAPAASPVRASAVGGQRPGSKNLNRFIEEA